MLFHTCRGLNVVRPGQEEDLADDRPIRTAIFGVMYTVCKEK